MQIKLIIALRVRNVVNNTDNEQPVHENQDSLVAFVCKILRI